MAVNWGVNLYQMVLYAPLGWPPVLPCATVYWRAQGGTGSVGSVVAPEESCTSLKVKVVMLMALAKLSFGGGGAKTVKVSGLDWPPPGGRFTTEMLLVPPNGPRRAAGRVAVRQVGSGQDAVGAATVMPFFAPLKRT